MYVWIGEDDDDIRLLSPVAAELLLQELHSAVMTLRGIRKLTLRQRVRRFLG